jgi:DNA-binding response OmpR family regulator
MKILIIEDDAALAEGLAYHLKRDGHDVDVAYDGLDGWNRVRSGAYELMLLDRMLPGMDGAAVLKKLRGARLALPVLMITAMGTLSDRVQGLDAGADDYLVKPFQTEELLARVRALMRRPAQIVDAGHLHCSELSLDEATSLLSLAGASCRLSRREASLLGQFMRHPNQTLPRELLLTRVWGDAPVEDGNLDNYIYFLRKRLKSVGWKGKIQTEHGLGYRLEDT